MSIKKDIFAPWSSGLGATRRAAMLLLVMMLTATTAWATTTSTINVGGTDYTLFTGFTATSGTEGTGVYVYGNMVDGDLSTSWHSTSDSQPYHVELYYVEFNSDDLIIPKGYIFNVFSADDYKPTGWTLKAKANEGDSWTELSIYSDQTLSGTEHSYSCNNSSNTKYKYFRFEVSANSNNIWLTEIRLYGFTELTYTHLSVKAATCTEKGIKQECWQRSDGKYFTDNTGTTELSASVVIEPMIPHTGVHHEASANNVEYWQCSMCNKYFSDSGCTNEITEAQTQVVKYLAADGTLTTLNENATAVTSSTTNWSSGWYVVYDDVTIADRISVSGTVNLILFDGATLTTSDGIGVGSDATYNVYAQSTDEATMGVLTATVSNTTANFNCAAIGGGNYTNFGTITINGGKITATGHNAGIGGGYGSNSGNITINGGIVVANAGEGINSAGIGGGNNGYVNSITLNGGIITATGDAQCGGAGIGTGSYAGSGTMTITITSGVKQIVATKGYSSDCIGKESHAQTTVNVVFKHNNTEVTGDDKNAVLYDTGDGVHRIIVPKDKKDKIIADIPDQIYTGSEIKPEPLVRVGSLVFTKGTDYEYSYTNNTNVGTAKVIVTFKGTNASQGSVEKEFNIVYPTVTTSYVDASGTLHENVIAIPLDNTMTTLAAGWYVVNSNVTYTSGITTTGNVTLILGDGCTMSFGTENAKLDATIMECQSRNLTIYGQSGGTGWLKAYSAQYNGIHVNNYTQYSGNVFIRHNNAYCIDANNSVALLGGTLDVENGGGVADGDISGGSISILGGKLWARHNGLHSPQGITLGYTNTTDQIYVTIYNAGGTGLEIADGKTLVDENGVIWSGALNHQIGGINGRTLKPLDYTGVTLTKDGYNVSATFSGLSETTVSIPVNVNVTSVTYNRTFTDGRPSTVMLPFSKDVNEISGGTFYTFGGVEKKNNKWVATMNVVTGSLTANTPYLFVPAGMSLTFTGGATLNTTGGGNCLASDTEGWVFHGTYSKKLWDEVETHDYGFAATSGTSADNQDVEAGQFVRLTTGASAKPMRCYLSYVGGPAQARALTRGAAATDEELPSSIIVRLVGANGQTTGIGTIDNGQLTIDNYADADGWYDLQGRKLSGKPTKSGLYIKNGKKFVIK